MDFSIHHAREGTFDSFSYCTSRGQLEAESIQNGIRFIYTLGDLESATGVVPQYISRATLDRVLAALDDDGVKFVQMKYVESGIGEDYLELIPAAMKGASQIRRLNKYFEQAGFTMRIMWQRWKIPVWKVQCLSRL